jgi:hypothetical protein
MSSESYHEASGLLSEETKNLHRAIVSLKEELEAVDWYQQRAEACSNDELRAVLVHNKNEEIEHAMMILEWLRRNSPEFATNIGTYLNSGVAVVDVEQQNTSDVLVHRRGGASTSLGIGNLKGVR